MKEQIAYIENNHRSDRIPPQSSGFMVENLIIELEGKCKKPLNRCAMRHRSIFTLKKDLKSLSRREIINKYE